MNKFENLNFNRGNNEGEKKKSESEKNTKIDDLYEGHLPAEGDWERYLEVTGNPMLKNMQFRAVKELELFETEDEEDKVRLKQELDELQNRSTEIDISTLSDIQQASKVGWDNFIESRKKDNEKFISMEESFKEFNENPENNNIELSYSLGNIVRAPEAKESEKMCDWQVVKAEAGHYLLEREDEESRKFGHVTCSEEELIGWNKKDTGKLENGVSKEVNSERLTNRVNAMLEIAEEYVNKKSIIANMGVEDLLESINNAEENEVDLLDIKNFQERVDKLKEAGPVAEIEGSLHNAKQFLGKDDKIPLASWYWLTKNKLDKYRGIIPKNNEDKISSELNEIAKELGI